MQPEPDLTGDATANMQANLLRMLLCKPHTAVHSAQFPDCMQCFAEHFLDEDQESSGLLHRRSVMKALHAADLNLSKRSYNNCTCALLLLKAN